MMVYGGWFQQQQYTVLASNGDQRWAGWEIRDGVKRANFWKK
jgi:hypothetical protein